MISRFRPLPEVIQTSQMDCGPASLQSLLAYFEIPVHYQKLRDACQTDVDGTSIDSLEAIAKTLGLDAEQVVLPVEHALAHSVQYFPAIAVVSLPNGFAHFVVIGRRLFGWVEVMDPASGRKWISESELERWLFRHEISFSAEEFLEWAETEEFRSAFRERGDRVLSSSGARAAFLAHWERAISERSVPAIADLDGSLRFVSELLASGALEKNEAGTLFEKLLGSPHLVPNASRVFRTLPKTAAEDGAGDEGGEEEAGDARSEEEAAISSSEVYGMRGVVLVRVRGKEIVDPKTLPADLGAALSPSKDVAFLAPFLSKERSTGWGLGLLVLLGGFLAAMEILVFRAAFGVPFGLRTFSTKGLFLGSLASLLLLGLFAEWIKWSLQLLLGRRLETNFREIFGAAIRRIPHRYFRSRLVSDLCERAFSVVRLRTFPEWATRLGRVVIDVVFAVAGLMWLLPYRRGTLLLLTALTLALPLAFFATLDRLDHRVRTVRGALFRFQLDALLGLLPLVTHSARSAILREQETMVAEHVRTSRKVASVQVGLSLLLALPTTLLAWVVLAETVRSGEIAKASLAIFLALLIPEYARELAALLPLYLEKRNALKRLVEPLGEAESPGDSLPPPNRFLKGDVELEGATVVLSGRTILSVDKLSLAEGEHVAIVGKSGAGKSFFLSLLLGLAEQTGGSIRVGGVIVDKHTAPILRRRVAWIDPGAQLWDETLLENIEYGNSSLGGDALADALQTAELDPVVRTLPRGLDTPLGEGGLRLSGGEGQRVRIARGMGREAPLLVVLDEPFRGLDREVRSRLLSRIRAKYHGVTLLVVTHDVREAMGFGRVLVFAGGAIVEDDDPKTLDGNEASHFHALRSAERALEEGVWTSPDWRHIHLGITHLGATPPGEVSEELSESL